MNINEYYQQGDVMIVKIKKIEGKKLNHLVLAEGEKTGHSHTITKGEAELYEKEGTLFLKVLSESATLTHQEHPPIEIELGEYKIGIVKEYDHWDEEAKEVKD